MGLPTIRSIQLRDSSTRGKLSSTLRYICWPRGQFRPKMEMWKPWSAVGDDRIPWGGGWRGAFVFVSICSWPVWQDLRAAATTYLTKGAAGSKIEPVVEGFPCLIWEDLRDSISLSGRQDHCSSRRDQVVRVKSGRCATAKQIRSPFPAENGTPNRSFSVAGFLQTFTRVSSDPRFQVRVVPSSTW